MKKILLTFFIFLLSVNFSFAARSFGVTNTAGSNVNYYMGDTILMTLRVTNTNTWPNTNEGIKKVTFTFPKSMLVNTSGNIAPTGWSYTVSTATNNITFTTTSSYITTGNYLDFTIRLTVQPATSDVAGETLSSVRVTYTSNRSVTKNSFTFTWNRRGLKILSMVANPDLLIPGDSFSLTITVQNVSSSTKTNITANPNPPSETQTNGFDPVTVSNPSIPSLAVNATGTLIYNYTTDPNFANEGTVIFSCNVKDNNNTTTGILTSSNTVYIGRFQASISVTPECPLNNETLTVTMTVSNKNSYSLSNVTPTLSVGGTATLVKITGPVPASVASLNAGATAVFNYTYQITGNYNDTFYFSGYATGTKTTPPIATRQTPTFTTPTKYIREYSLNLTPDSIFSGAKNFYLTFQLTNKVNALCGNDPNYDVKKVSFTIPSGFVYATGELGYLIGNNIADPNDPNYEFYDAGWTVNDTTSPIYVTAGSNATYYLSSGKDAFFTLFFKEAPKVNNNTLYNFVTVVENASGSTVTINNTSVQLLVTNNNGNLLKKVKGSFREKLE